MKKIAVVSSFFIVSSALTLTACSRGERGGGASSTAGSTARFQCPMHPTIVQDGKGDCPICGMKLVAAREAGAPAAAQAAAKPRWQCPMHPEVVDDHESRCPACGMKLVAAEARSAAPGSAAVAATPEQQRALGVRVVAVGTGAARRDLRLLGRVAPDEARVYRVNAGMAGSFREVKPFTTGSRVRKDELLATVYAPDVLPAINQLLINYEAHDRILKAETDGSPEAQGRRLVTVNMLQREMQLDNLGVPGPQRKEIGRTRQLPEALWVVSPADGFVLARNASPGTKFDRGMELYKIADLRRVWVVADVFPKDAGQVHAGMSARIAVAEQGLELPARVSEVLPQFDPATRTHKVRLELDNPGFVLRPDMFVDVTLPVALPAALTVPADAVVDQGVARTVYVETAPGTFEPRPIQTGWRSGDQVQVVRGLSPGDRVVASGAFFLDSETRMRAPLSSAAVPSAAPPAPNGRERHSHGGAESPPQRAVALGEQGAAVAGGRP
ncbi:MAG TPA: efflux RND transporter periplasmic adaptor subunit [Anaeromyxobacteraceae bacterium]|nr:efflux RND transporter periplasmic adaptor subunit [Anaeromyxobacteraceae bacterium]